jgi:transcriptional regulator of heat shock response
MVDRKEELIRGIVDLYVSSAEPVGSQALLEFLGLTVSSATVRNDLKELEEEGFVLSPHTSAGRIPTIRAYRTYVERFLQPTVPEMLRDVLSTPPSGNDVARTIKHIAKQQADALNAAVFLVLSREQTYYTGLTHLFSQPEFVAHGSVQNVTALLDRFDDMAPDLYRLLGDKDMYLHIGKGNPFGDACTILLVPFTWTSGTTSLLGIVGPTRMDYNAIIGSMRATKEYLKTYFTV